MFQKYASMSPIHVKCDQESEKRVKQGSLIKYNQWTRVTQQIADD